MLECKSHVYINNQDISLSDCSYNTTKIVKLATTNLLQINNPLAQQRNIKKQYPNLTILLPIIVNPPNLVHLIKRKCINKLYMHNMHKFYLYMPKNRTK